MNDSEESTEVDIYEPEKKTVQVEPAPEMLSDPGVEQEEEKRREEAFGSGPLKWNGKELRPWSSARESHWLEVRHALGARHLSECILSSYAFLPDALRILFLCHAEQSLIEGLRGDPLAFQNAVDRWVDENVAINQHDDAVTVAMRLYNLAHENHAVSAPAEGDLSADDSGN